MWFFSNYFYNSGLSSTSVSSSTVLCNTSSIFVYIFGIFMLKDVRFDIFKSFMVLISFSGIVLVAISDRENST
jgi:drug/metabolite transporter (DMT)-like permease